MTYAADDDDVELGTAEAGCLSTHWPRGLQWTHLQLISFAIAPVVLIIVHLLKRLSGGAIANESPVLVVVQNAVMKTLYLFRYDDKMVSS